MVQRDLSVELDAAQRKIHEHPGFKEHQELDALALSLEAVFGGNLGELIAMLDAAATDEDLAAELIQNVRPPEVRGAVSRATHASASQLPCERSEPG